MARTKKLAQLVAALPAREWAPLDDAFERVERWARSADLAGHDLKEDFLTRRLQGAVRIDHDGTEACFIFEPAWWRPFKISCPPILILGSTGRCRVEGVAEGWDLKQGKWHWFVRRVGLHEHYPDADLDKLYPVAAPSVQADNPPPSRRRPGPKPTEDWPTLVGAWLVAEALKNREKFPRRNLINVDSLVEEAAVFLEKQIGWAPKDHKDLRAYILSYLHFVRP
jgi:hypothetical protein